MNNIKLKKVPSVTDTGKKSKSKNKSLVTVICCIVLLITAVVIFWDSITLIFPDFNNNIYKFTYPTSQSRKFVPFKNNMIFCCSDGIYCIDSKGNEKWMVPIVFDQPIIAASDYGVVAASKNSTTIYTIDASGKTKEFSSNFPVLNLKIAEKGNILAIIDKQNYSGAVEIYDNNGTPLFVWSAGSVNFVDAALSSDGRKLAISSIATGGVELDCRIQLFDIYNSETPYAETTLGNNLVSYVKWVDSSRILCAGDKAFVSLDRKANQKWTYDYNDLTLNFVSIGNKNNIVLALGSDALDLNMSIRSLNMAGKLNSQFDYDGSIYSISSNDKRILISSSNGVTAYDKKGHLREKLKSNKEIYTGYILPGNTAFLDEGGFSEISHIR